MKTTIFALFVCAGAAPAWPATCEGLAAFSQPHVAVTLAATVGPGQFTAPNPRGGRALEYRTLPAFCRVAATLTPSSDSDIRIEVWLPAAAGATGGWNGKLVAVGNGAWAGNISYPALATALMSGYATVSTDTGHVG